MLVGNKCECVSPQRAVVKERGIKIAENFDMPFFEVSCKHNINIEESFLSLARSIREQREHRGDNCDDGNRQKSDQRTNSLGPFSLGGSSAGGRCSC